MEEIKKKRKNDPIKQHFVSRMYLENFTNNNGYLEVYDSIENKFLEPQLPKNTGYEKHGYTVIDNTGKKLYLIEDKLAEIEGPSKLILDKLIHKEKITYQEKELISLFFALLQQRTPKNFQYTKNSVDTYKKSILKFVNSMDDNIKNIPENQKLIKELESKTTKNECLDMMFCNEELITFMVNVYMNQNWVFTEIPDKYSIITSDNPVSLHTKLKTVSFIEAKKIIPISSHLILNVFVKGNEFKYIKSTTEEQIKGACVNTFINRNRFIYSCEKKMIIEMAKVTNNFRSEIKITASNLINGEENQCLI